MKTALGLLAIFCAAFGASCSCQPANTMCAVASDCPTGYTCAQQLCVRTTDGGSPDGAVADASDLDRTAADAQRTDQHQGDSAHTDRAVDAGANDRTTRDSWTGDLAARDSTARDSAGSDGAAVDVATGFDTTHPADAAIGADGAAAGDSAVAPDAADAAVCIRDCTLKCNGAVDGCGGGCWGPCDPGYDCNALAKQCVDVDECQLYTDGCDPCSTTCFNTVGSHRCDCRDGFDSSNGRRCQYRDDGDLNVTGNFNLSMLARYADRACADGEVFSITGISSNVVTVVETVPACCLVPGSSVLLVELQGTSADTAFTGNYRIDTVFDADNHLVTLTNDVAHAFGNSSVPLSLIGTTPGLHKVALYRLPRYNSVTVSSSARLTAMPWNGVKGGVLALRSATEIDVKGAIEMTGAGFSGGDSYCGMAGGNGNAFQGESIGGPGERFASNNIGGGGGGCYSPSCVTSGGGAGYGEAGDGAPASCSEGACMNSVLGGEVYGSNSNLMEKSFLGSGGGGAGQYTFGVTCSDFPGSPGGGIILLLSNALTVSIGGGVHADGLLGIGGTQVGGSGSGGSILLQQNSATLGTGQVTAVGGRGSSNVPTGGNGRILCNGSCSGTHVP